LERPAILQFTAVSEWPNNKAPGKQGEEEAKQESKQYEPGKTNKIPPCAEGMEKTRTLVSNCNRYQQWNAAKPYPTGPRRREKQLCSCGSHCHAERGG
jgi:hypothetical protein